MADQPGRLLVFVHIPKTAGTTLRAILNMTEPDSRSRALANVFKGGGGVGTALLSRLRKGTGPDFEGVRLVRGHFPLGIREYLPTDRDVRYFTFLRRPADRTLSHYFAIRESGSHYGLPPLPADATLDDALAGGYIHDNLQTRMLSDVLEPFGEVTEEILEQAKRNLREELAFVGITERFDESLVIAKQRLDLRAILYRTSGRVNATRPRGKDVPAELVAAAERCNRYDIELYDYATELFDQAPERRQLDFEVELAALRAAKADGELEVRAEPPATFGGDEAAWRMLVEARAIAQRLEWEGARHRVPHVPETVQEEARESELKAARSQLRKLEREVERLKEGSQLRSARARARRLEQEVEGLRGARSQAKRLERALERYRDGSELKAARSQAMELEQEVDRLKADRSKTKRLEQQIELLQGARTRARRLEQEVERLRVPASRSEELEQELERSSKRIGELEERVERLKGVRSRKHKLEQKVERLKARQREAAPQTGGEDGAGPVPPPAESR